MNANAPWLANESWLAPEARPFYLTPLLLALVAAILGYVAVALVAAILSLLIALFFRNPRRAIALDERLFLSPADGRVVDISEIDTQKIAGQPSRRVSIFLSVLDVHINRYPCAAEVVSVQYNPGKFLAAFNEKASLDNEQQATLLRTRQGHLVMVVQIAGLIARRIVCYAQPQQQVQPGQLLGLIRFGSRVDIWLPASATILVQTGQRLRGGESIVALMQGAA